MCKYCDGEFIGEKPITPITDNISGIEIMVDGEFLYAFCKSGEKAVAEIHYCPMCGGKLKESQRIDTGNLVREIESLIAENRETLERLKDRMETGKW